MDEASEFIKQINTNSLTHLAVDQIDSEKLVETICLFDVSEVQRKYQIGYELLTQHLGRGLMREATTKIIKYASQTLGLQTIVAFSDRDNDRSISLFKELNFRREDSADGAKSNLILFRLNIFDISN